MRSSPVRLLRGIPFGRCNVAGVLLLAIVQRACARIGPPIWCWLGAFPVGADERSEALARAVIGCGLRKQENGKDPEDRCEVPAEAELDHSVCHEPSSGQKNFNGTWL